MKDKHDIFRRQHTKLRDILSSLKPGENRSSTRSQQSDYAPR